MIYLDHGATSFHKPESVCKAVCKAMRTCANPGRGGYQAAWQAEQTVFECRKNAARFFDCLPEQVVFTSNCTHGLNIAIRSLVKPGTKVVISGFEHNAVTRLLHLLKADVRIAGRRLFDWEEMLSAFERELKNGAQVAIFTHVSNVFGYILPVFMMAQLCHRYQVPFIVDAAQSAGSLPVSLQNWGADFVAMPGHKGLLGPQGTGILLCGRKPEPLIAGGTGSESRNQQMPQDTPERSEAGTLNVPGIAGLNAGIQFIQSMGMEHIFRKEALAAKQCGTLLSEMGLSVFCGPHQSGTVSFVPEIDCEEMAEKLANRGIAVRAGLHCAPLAHESAGTLETGTVRISFGHDVQIKQILEFEREIRRIIDK